MNKICLKRSKQNEKFKNKKNERKIKHGFSIKSKLN